MSDIQIGMVNAIPNIVLPGQLLAAALLLRHGKRKKTFLLYCLSVRICIALLGILLIYQSHSPEISLILPFMILFACMHLGASMSLPLWFAWIGDLIPERNMAEFWGMRNILSNIAGLVCSLLLGYALDYDMNLLQMLGSILLLSFILSSIETIWGYYNLPDHQPLSSEQTGGDQGSHLPHQQTSTPSIRTIFKSALSNRNFLSFSGYAMLYGFGVFLVIPFFFIHFKHLGMSNLSIQMWLAVAGLGAMCGSQFSSSLANVLPNKQVLMINVLIKTFVMMGYLILKGDTAIQWLIILFSVDGFLNGGIMTCSMSLLTAETPRESRSIFTALYFSLVGAAGFAGSTLSGLIMDLLNGQSIQWAGFHWLPFHFLLCLCIACIGLSLLTLSFFNSSMSGSTWSSMLMLFEGSPFLSFIRLTKLPGHKHHDHRLQFIRRNRSKLFLPEVLDAVNDPSPAIRQAAVYSLGFFHDERSEKKLLAVCEEGVLGLEHLAIEGLGRLRCVSASKMLVELLTSKDVLVRKASAWALGQIKDRSSLSALKQHLAKEDNHAVAAELADALSQFGDLSSIPHIFPHFKKLTQTCLRRQYGVALANILGKVGEFYPMLMDEKNNPGLVRTRLIKELQKKGAKAQWLNLFQDHFDEDDFDIVIRMCFRSAFHRYYPNLNLEAMIEKDVMSWDNEDFDKAVGGMDHLITQTGPVDYTLWLLTILNVQWEGQSQPDLEDALLALYLLAQIY
jgi:MFS family permease